MNKDINTQALQCFTDLSRKDLHRVKNLPLHSFSAGVVVSIAVSTAMSTAVIQARWEYDLKHTSHVNEARQASGKRE